MPSDLTRIFMLLAVAAYAGASAILLCRLRGRPAAVSMPLGVLFLVGWAANAAVGGLRTWGGHWLLAGTFDVFAILAFLLAGMAGYLKFVDRRQASEVFLLPAATVCGVVAMVLSGSAYREFWPGLWHAAHLTLAMAGTLCLTVSAGVGVLYLRVHRRLRRKDLAAIGRGGPSLEKLGRVLRHSIPVGFAILTATMVIGFYGGFLADRDHWVHTWWKHPKMVMALVAWLVYAVALHAAYARRFRARRAAVLSIVGLGLVVVVLLLSLLTPSAGL